MTFLARYQQGETLAVWDELNALGEEVLARKIRDDARAVAMETMRRARVNLQTLGFPFRPAWRSAADTIKALEKQLNGKLPYSLHAWWLHVGEVERPGLIVFPLEPAAMYKPQRPFFPPRRAWETSIEAWRRQLRAEGLAPEEAEAKMASAIAEFEAQDEEYDRLADLPFDPRVCHPLMPDEVAGGTINVRLPHPAADFPLENMDGAPLFVPWLRRYFEGLGNTSLLPL